MVSLPSHSVGKGEYIIYTGYMHYKAGYFDSLSYINMHIAFVVIQMYIVYQQIYNVLYCTVKILWSF